LLELVKEIGAAAGAAAILGLPALAVLHLSHARDIKLLREWAGRAPERSKRGMTVALALVGLLVLGGAAAYAATRSSGDDAADAPAIRSPSKPKRKGAAVKPGTVTVAVLNGTTVPGLAAALRDQVAAAGFKKGTIDVNSEQQLTASVVQYAPGHEAAAKAVGRALAISGREPVTPESRALAPDATVIVIAGADKAP
jgi:hypothetical protein